MNGYEMRRIVARVAEYIRTHGPVAEETMRDALGLGQALAHRAVLVLMKKTAASGLQLRLSLPPEGPLPTQNARRGDVQEKLWRAMRIKRTFHAFDVAQLSGASLDYTKKYLQFLMKLGLVRRIGLDKHQARYRVKDKPPLTAPHWRRDIGAAKEGSMQGKANADRDERIYVAWKNSGEKLTCAQLAERFGISRGGAGSVLRRMRRLKEPAAKGA